MKRVLIVVDVQNDFVDGVLGSKEAQAIIPAVKESCLLNTALWGLADIELSMVWRHIIVDILISRHSDMRDGLRC